MEQPGTGNKKKTFIVTNVFIFLGLIHQNKNLKKILFLE